VHTVVVGGMPGWQIALIAAATAIFAAGLAVILDRARAARAADRAGPVTWAGGSPRTVPGAAFTAQGGMLDVLDTFGTAGAGGAGAVSGRRARVLRGGTAHRDG
jgi:hypothetical protein